MKTRCFVLALAIIAGVANTIAATHTVDNRPGRAADFDDLQDAIAAALPGDTLYVMGSQFSYGAITLAKPLTIYGPGYLLGENHIAVAEANHANLNSLAITANAAGSLLVGLHLGGTLSSHDITINGATGVSFRRCYFSQRVDVGTSSFVDGLSFEQCIFGSIVRLGTLSAHPGAVNVVFSNSRILNLTFSNNNSEALIDQCVLGGANVRNATIRNSIFLGASDLIFDNETTIEYSLGPGNLLPEGNGNINNANLDLVFVGWNSGNPPGPATLDTWTQLIPSPLNPALEAGSNGQDLGMYGGAFPYVVSGVPPLPRITSLISPAVIRSGDPITVDVQVETGE